MIILHFQGNVRGRAEGPARRALPHQDQPVHQAQRHLCHSLVHHRLNTVNNICVTLATAVNMSICTSCHEAHEVLSQQSKNTSY